MKSVILNPVETKHSITNLAKSLEKRWQNLCRRFLPIGGEDSIWRYNRRRKPLDPEQGWKLHVSATILNASDLLEIVAPFLESQEAFYKAPESLRELKKLNSGIYYDYSQVGKFITIYPRNDEHATFLAERLHRLTLRNSSPTIPFDLRYQPKSSVFYRYGAFKIKKIDNTDGSIVLALKDEKGNLIPDVRDGENSHPAWISNPFPVEQKEISANESYLKKNFRILRALSQRGKGGVYQGLDLTSNAPRVCVLKEGRENGEVDWDGRDGFWRVKHEASVIEHLRKAGVEVPEIYSAFESENNYYVAAEFIEGENLHAFLKRKRRRINIKQAVKLAAEIAEILNRIHAAGWLWRDCKPGNLIVTKKGTLRPLDFEGACLISRPDPIPWTTLKTDSQELNELLFKESNAAVDLFALGALFYLLVEGKSPVVGKDSKPKISRRNVSEEIKQMIAELLEPDKARHLKISAVAERLADFKKVK
jgi:Protein kinase domain